MSLADRIDAYDAPEGPDARRFTETSVDEAEQLVAVAPVPPEVLATVLAEVRRRLTDTPGTSSMSSEELRSAVDTELAAVLASPDVDVDRALYRDLRAAILNEILGFGLLQDLLDDPSVSEVMVNGAANVFVESGGRLVRWPRVFESDEELLGVIGRMVRSTGRRVDQSSPMVDGRLPDGSRLNVVLPPLAVDGPAVTIRKFTSNSLTVADLVANGSLSAEAGEFLQEAVERRLNILVSGGTGTGKTTMLNFLSSYIDRSQRVVTVEDAVELTLDMPNLIRLETRPPSIEGHGEVTIRDLVRNALRMRPDRIVVGEVRGAEALDMLQAMNTGHEGSLSTLHANSPRDALRRIETMVLFGGIELPLRAIREQVAAALDLVVHVSRDMTGFRYVSSITEVVGMESDVISTAELFNRGPGGSGGGHAVTAPLTPTGIRCAALDRVGGGTH